ncbi:MAG: hypothetical protein ACR2ID_11585 [Chthoniobacterales bacterium]
MIAISFALPAESSEFIKLLAHRARGDGVYSGVLHGHSVSVFHTGVGAAAARASVEKFFATTTPRLLISSGFAGALDSDFSVGELLLADNYSPGAGAGTLRTRAGLRAGTLANADAVLDAPADRAALAARTGAVAVDMETATIAAACLARGIPLLALRVISDTPSAPFPLPATVLFDLERQRTIPSRLLFHLATHPATIPRLARFARQISTARHSLTRGLDALFCGEDLLPV